MALNRLFSCLVLVALASVGNGLPATVTAPPEVSAQCPYTPGRYPLLLPNPVDCGSFYMCGWYGTAVLQHCPPVLHFNAHLQVCDSPVTANCVLRTTPATLTTAAVPVSNETTSELVTSDDPVSNVTTGEPVTTGVPASNVTAGEPVSNTTVALPVSTGVPVTTYIPETTHLPVSNETVASK